MTTKAYKTNLDKMVETGLRLFHSNGYNNTGLKEILDTAGVPKGSFYHYFKSKEDFGIHVIEQYGEIIFRIMRKTTDNLEIPADMALYRYFYIIKTHMSKSRYERGCLMGNFANELSGVNENIRKALDEMFKKVESAFAVCLERGRSEGVFTYAMRSEEMAQFLFASWQGALMRAKNARSDAPVDAFMENIFAMLGVTVISEFQQCDMFGG